MVMLRCSRGTTRGGAAMREHLLVGVGDGISSYGGRLRQRID
eukprot:gene10485-biopygen8362